MDLLKLKSISQQSYDVSLKKSNALRKAESDLVTVYRYHIFRADTLTICTVRTLMESNSTFFILDTNLNPVEIVNPGEFLETLTQRNQSALNTYHQAYQKFKSKES